MTGTRVSIGGLLAIVVFAAVGLAALRSATDLWASLVNTAALAVLGFAIVAAVVRRGASRTFWLAFVVFGAGYLALASGPQSARRLPTTPRMARRRATIHRTPHSPGDRLLVTRQGTTAPAMVLEVRDGTYKVNFDGWSSYHDEWVGEGRIVGPVPPNLPGPAASGTALVALLSNGTENFQLARPLPRRAPRRHGRRPGRAVLVRRARRGRRATALRPRAVTLSPWCAPLG